MATTKLSELSAHTTTDGAEELLINDGGTSKKVTIANLLHDNSIDSDHYVDGSIDNAHLADDAVDSDEIAAGAIDLAHMSSESVDEDNLHISNSGSNGQFLSKQSGDAGGLTWASVSSVSTATSSATGVIKLEDDTDQSVAANAVSATAGRTYGLQLNSSDQGVVNVPWTDTNTTYSVGDGGLTTNDFTNDDHTKLNGIEASATADQTAGEVLTLIEDGVDSVHYKDGSIDHVHLAADCIDGDNIQDDVINSEHIVAGSVDLEHMSSESVDEDNLHISNAGSNGQLLTKQSDDAGGMTWQDAPQGVSNSKLFYYGSFT